MRIVYQMSENRPHCQYPKITIVLGCRMGVGTGGGGKGQGNHGHPTFWTGAASNVV